MKMGGSLNKVVVLPTIYHFEIGQKVKARNTTSGEITFGTIQASLLISHGYIIKSSYNNKLMYFDGREISPDDRG